MQCGHFVCVGQNAHHVWFGRLNLAFCAILQWNHLVRMVFYSLRWVYLGRVVLRHHLEWPVADLGSPSTDLEFGRINVIFLSLGTVFGLRVYTLKVSNVRNCSCIDWSSVCGCRGVSRKTSFIVKVLKHDARGAESFRILLPHLSNPSNVNRHELQPPLLYTTVVKRGSAAN